MDKKTFRDGFKDAAEQIDVPNSEWSSMVNDFVELRDELTEHDPVLGQKANAVVTALNEFGAYIKSRNESSLEG